MGRKGKEITEAEKKIIIRLHKEKKSLREIGRTVARSFATIQYIIKKFKNDGSTANARRRGRPKRLTERERHAIRREVQKNPKISAPKLVGIIQQSFNKHVSTDTVRRVLHSEGYKARVARKKPLINKVNRLKRLAFAKQYCNASPEFWTKVIFTDESKYNVFGSDGRHLVWRKPGEALKQRNLRATVKHGGGSVMVWGCMSANGVGNVAIIPGIMDRFVYLNILKANLIQSAEKLGIAGDFSFYQDNDPKHSARVVQEWLLYNTPKVLKTPPQSPDLNPIEHLWHHLEQRIRQYHISNKMGLENILKEKWHKIDPKYTANLVESMPRRLRAVIDAGGGATRY